MLSICKHYDIPEWKSVVFTVLVYFSTLAWMLFLYWADSRFFLEFLRDNDKLFWGISGLALRTMLNGVVGTIAFFLIKRKNKIQVNHNATEE